MLWRGLMTAGMEAASLSSPTAQGQMEMMLQQHVLVLWDSQGWGAGGSRGESGAGKGQTQAVSARNSLRLWL